MARKEATRQDRFVWNEGDAHIYDANGNRIDPKTGKPIKSENDPFAARIKKLIMEEQKKKKNG